MPRKARTEITAESVRQAIKEGKPTSMTQLAHGLGYRGSVSSSLTRKFRALFPDLDVLLKRTAESARGDGNGKAKVAKPKTVAAKGNGKWPHDGRSKFRPNCCYDKCFSILAAHKAGLKRQELVRLLAEATGKDLAHAGYDAQVVLSARPNENGLNNNDSPRHKSCRPGFWIEKTNDHVKLMVD